ncbi:MAG: DMT family transporter [Alphaproteobacteria bacterium]|nr:MAG: DMT family transporter [Alphaproteobacteria bacterium]
MRTENLSYLKASLWFTMSILCGFFNDFILRYIAVNNTIMIPVVQATFYRFFFSACFLFPFFIVGKKSSLTAQSKNHFIRSILLLVPMLLWTYGVSHSSLIFATFMEFSIPFFVSIIAYFFLHESIEKRLVSIVLGCAGVFLVAFKYIEFSSLYVVFAMVLACILYATLDVVNKYLLNKNESLINMLFFSSLGVSILTLPFILCCYVAIPINYLILYVIQGLLGNFLIFFILKAYQLESISALQPLRFISFPLSILFGLKLGDNISFLYIIFGFSFLLLSLIYSINHELKK